jgi:Protein of unknown function (DUF3780)
MSSSPSIDFGFDPARSPHHFAVVPMGQTSVQFLERFSYGEVDPDDPVAPKEVVKGELDVERWRRVREEAADAFNAHVRGGGRRATSFRKDAPTLLAPHLGRELMLLVWATEGQDLSVIPAIRLNWRGFAPEERWWLYSTINASSRHPEHADRGWRKAIKIALAENPVNTDAFLSEPRVPAPRPRTRKRGIGEEEQLSLLEPDAIQPDLFSPSLVQE